MEIEVTVEKITEADVPDLTRAMTEAFDDDTRTYLGIEKGGPDGYDDGRFFHKWLFAYDECEGYKILVGGKIVGGILVWIYRNRKNTWGSVFVDPAWQNRGVCTQAWRQVERLYPEAISWTLGTPGYSLKNHRVYEKLGFVKIKEVDAPEHTGKSFVYRKTLPSKK